MHQALQHALPAAISVIGEGPFASCSALTTISVDPTNPHFASADGVLFDKTFQTLIQAPGGLAGAYSLPADVTTIGNSAFRRCNKLTGITLPEGLASIGDNAFDTCSKLSGITLPDGLGSIGDYAFWFCASLTSINIPGGVGSIREGTFSNCPLLKSVTLQPGIVSIEEHAFSSCPNLGSVTLPESLRSIGTAAFYADTELTSINLPASLTSIGDHAFDSCFRLKNVSPPPSLTYIGDSAFFACPGLAHLTTLDLPAITYIGSRAFDGCSKLTAVTLSDNLVFIGSWAFLSCSSLTNITLPASLSSIRDYAFSDCSKLREVRFLGDAPSMGNGLDSGSTVFSSVAPGFTIYYPADATGFTSPTWLGYRALAYFPDFAAYAASVGLGGADAAPDADPDHDGMSNILEYALATSPGLTTATAQLPACVLQTVNNQPALVYTHRRLKGALLGYAYKTSTDLVSPVADWPELTVTPLIIQSDADGDGRVEVVSVTVPLGDTPRRFLSLQVSE